MVHEARCGMVGQFGNAGVRCKMIKEKKEGELVCYFNIRQLWCAVIWDGDNSPVCIKASAILVKPDGRWVKLP